MLCSNVKTKITLILYSYMAVLLSSRKIILSLIFFLFLNFFLQIHISADDIEHQYCNNNIGNYTNNSNFQSNLKTIISSITTKINTYGFYNNSLGDGADQVNVIGFCRGDIDIESCRNCLNDAARNLTLICPNQMEAIKWYEKCMFRYSNNKILGIPYLDLVQSFTKLRSNTTSNPAWFSRLNSLAGALVEKAYNGTSLKYAGLKTTYPDGQTIFGCMQCTPDITPDDCKSCLQSCENWLSSTFDRVGAIRATPSCNFRYERFSFLNNFSIQLPPTSTQPPPTGKGKSMTVIIVVCVVVALLVLTQIGNCFFFTRRRWKNTRRGHRLNDEEEELEAIGDRETRQYDFTLMRDATNNFSTANLLGRGGFGDVYKGVLSNGKEIAVKRLSTTSVQGENEFRNEVMLLAKLQHKCLVKLLGFCLEQTERLLVYEFMANGSLDNLLFDVVNRSRLDWSERYGILNNIAKGLLYLHEDSRLTIIHRDLKASNILHDKDMNAKISDFGMARLFVWDESEANTKRIAGTMGYMAPEYAMHGLFSVKSDVYSYGVLLLEIVSGKRNYYSLTEDNSEGLLSYAYETWKDGRASDLIDPVLTAHSYRPEMIIRCIHMALLCVQENVGSRPTMATIVHMLQSSTMILPIPSDPGFFSHTRTRVLESQESTNSSSQSKSKSGHTIARNGTPLTDDETDSYLYPR